jgi:hypothetical protein
MILYLIIKPKLHFLVARTERKTVEILRLHFPSKFETADMLVVAKMFMVKAFLIAKGKISKTSGR